MCVCVCVLGFIVCVCGCGGGYRCVCVCVCVTIYTVDIASSSLIFTALNAHGFSDGGFSPRFRSLLNWLYLHLSEQTKPAKL